MRLALDEFPKAFNFDYGYFESRFFVVLLFLAAVISDVLVCCRKLMLYIGLVSRL